MELFLSPNKEAFVKLNENESVINIHLRERTKQDGKCVELSKVMNKLDKEFYFGGISLDF